MITAPQEVIECIGRVREEGRCNMFDRWCVQAVANAMGCHTTVIWIEQNDKDYGKLSAIMQGFTPAEDESNV